MRKEKFVYNTHTLRYEKVEESLSTRIIRVFGFICAAIFTAFLFTLVLHRYFPSPKEKALIRELDQAKSEIDNLIDNFGVVNEELKHLQERDAYVYRMILGMDPIDQGVLEGGVGGHDEYDLFRTMKHSGKILVDAKQKVRKLKHQMVLHSKSMDTIIRVSNEKEKMLASIPSIKPVRSDRLARGVLLLSGFGYRIHPIYKTRKMHYGIDFTAPSGTPIQATGDGVIKKVERRSTGYGRSVVIDHGYGYETRYAHMYRIDVNVGDKVVRGQKIGVVGSTGTSTAPHCHYEVVFRGKKVNPIDYVMDGLTPKEYQELVKAAETVNQSMD